MIRWFICMLTMLLLILLLGLPITSLAGEGIWTKKANAPIEEYYAVTMNNKVYLVSFDVNVDKMQWHIWEYKPVLDTWAEKAMSQKIDERDFTSICVANNKLYAMGGLKGGGHKDVYEYDPIKDKWEQKQDLLEPRAAAPSCSINGKIYLFSGVDQNNFYIQSVEEYDPINGKSKQKVNTPKVFCDRANAVAVNGKAYIMDFGSIWEYDPVKDIYAQMTTAPTKRYFYSVCAVEGKIYVFGGFGEEFTLSTVVEEYDTDTDTWTQKPDMPTKRSWDVITNHAAAINGKIYVIGGYGQNFTVLKTVEEFDTGLSGQSIGLEGKLPYTWGKIKSIK